MWITLWIVVVARASPSPAIAPWPVLGHDSSGSYAAPLNVPVFNNYTNSALPFYFPGFEPGAVPAMYIPSPGIYILTTPNNITLYNRSSDTLRSIDPQAGPTPDVLGFDPSGSLRMYVFTFGKPFGIGAFSISTGAMIWSMQNASMRELDAVVDTVTDSIYASFSLVGQGTAKLPYIARFDGATGSLLWVVQSGKAGDLPASIGGTSPASGALIYELSNAPSGTAARSASTGNLLWEFNSDLNFASLEIGAYQFDYDGNSVYALNTTSGSLLWNSTVLAKLGCNLNGYAYAAITLSGSTQGVVTACSSGASRPLLIIIDIRTGLLLYKLAAASADDTIESIVTVGPNVFYTAGTSVYRWLATSHAASAVYTSADVLLGNIYIDSDGAMLAAPLYGDQARTRRTPDSDANIVQLLTGVQ